MYHGDAAADEAQARFETMHQRQEIPADLEEISLDAPCPIVELLHRFRIAPSKSEARRLVDGGGVRLDGDTIGRYDHVVTGGVLQVGKRRIYRVVVRG
jgi:tyrosyl-tRNA synthetase